MATQNELLGEVLTILCQLSAYWTSCVTVDAGVTEATLLTQLIATFPQTNWTQLLLDEILEFGARRGALTSCNSVDPITWYARRDMVRVNPVNEQYRVVCSEIYEQQTRANQFSTL